MITATCQPPRLALPHPVTPGHSSSSRGMAVRGSLLLDSLRGALLSGSPAAVVVVAKPGPEDGAPHAAVACQQHVAVRAVAGGCVQSCSCAAAKRVAVLQGEVEGLCCKLDGYKHALRDYEQQVAMLRAALATANSQSAAETSARHHLQPRQPGGQDGLQLSPGGGPALCLLPQLSQAASTEWFEVGPETPLGNDTTGRATAASGSTSSSAAGSAGRQLALSASLDGLSLTAAAAAGLGRESASAAGAEGQTQEEEGASSDALQWWRPPSTAPRYSSARAGSDGTSDGHLQDEEEEEHGEVLTGSAAPSPTAAAQPAAATTHAVATAPPCKPPQPQDTVLGSSRIADGIRQADDMCRKGIGRGSLTTSGLFGLHVHDLPAGLTCSCDNPLFDAADAWE